MKYKYLSIILLLFYCVYAKQIEKSSVKEMLLGYWQQTSDPNHVIVISNDTIKSFYKGKLDDVSRLKFNFPKTEEKYFNVANKTFWFDVNDTNIYKLELIDSENITTTQQVNYVDKDNLELGYYTGIVSFKRVNPTKNKLIK